MDHNRRQNREPEGCILGLIELYEQALADAHSMPVGDVRTWYLAKLRAGQQRHASFGNEPKDSSE
jgi:hypothetical protein